MGRPSWGCPQPVLTWRPRWSPHFRAEQSGWEMMQDTEAQSPETSGQSPRGEETRVDLGSGEAPCRRGGTGCGLEQEQGWGRRENGKPTKRAYVQSP